jgi:hypothetical protein
VPFNPYRIDVSANGFAPLSQNVEIRSVGGNNLKLVLQIAGASQTVTVEASGDLVENDPTFHTDVDRDLFIKVPLESQSSTLSSLVTETTPGVAADSNGLFHGLGDHASNSFSVDGQSITDQQSKVFSNQLPSNSIQSIEVISGAPPAEYGGKTSLVIVATTRSGQGVTKPTGSISSSYGAFGSATAASISPTAARTGATSSRPTASTPDAFSIRRSSPSSTTRATSRISSTAWTTASRRPTPFTSTELQPLLVPDAELLRQPERAERVSGGASANPTFGNVGNADQRSKIGTFNISPTYTRSSATTRSSTWALCPQGLYNYYPSGNPLADLGPSNLQTSSISQYRTLTNAAVHSDFSYVQGNQQHQGGAQYGQTFLRENDSLGVVEATYNSPCIDVNGNPLPGLFRSNPMRRCDGNVAIANPNYLRSCALRSDPRRHFLQLLGHTDVKELASTHRRPDQGRQLALQPGSARGRLQRPHGCQPDGAARGHRLQHQALQHRAAHLLCAHAGDAVQREPGAVQQAARTRCWRRCSTALQAFPGTMQPGFRNEFHAGLQQASAKRRGQRRVHLEVHPQRLRLQRAGQHAHHLPHRLA